MAKKTVVEIQCDRCPRREYIDPETTKSVGPVTIQFMGETTTFTDLCSACFKAVAAHIEGITKKLDGRSPERTAKQKAAPEGAAVAAAVDVLVSPSQPHASAPRKSGPGALRGAPSTPE
jgi:hypothetical protein